MKAPTARQSVALVASAAALVLATTLVQPTDASWADPEYATGTFTSATVLPPTGLVCTPKSGLLTLTGITLNWTAPTATATGVVPTSYKLTITNPGGGVVYTTTTTGTSAIFSPALITLGTTTASVVGLYGTSSWTSTAATDTISNLLGTTYTCSS